MDALGRHRIAFNNIGVQLFGELERDLELVLKKGAEEKAELERIVNDQKRLLEEGGTGLQQAAKIGEQKKKIDELNLELAKALVENERLEELFSPKKLDWETQRTASEIARREPLQNKENIPPIFNYLAPSARKVPILDRLVSSPLKSPRKQPVRSSSSNDHGVQTESVYQTDREVQTDSIPVSGDFIIAYYELAASYDVLRDELNTYKGAHKELQEKYLKNKKVWEAWTKSDAERREQSKKRKREGSAISEAGGRQIVHSYTTPARSTAGHSSDSIPPPTLSPNMPLFKSPVFHTISKKPALFASFKGSPKTGASGDLDVNIGASASIRNVETKGVIPSEKRLHLGPEESGNTSWPSSISETPAPAEAIGNHNTISHKNTKSPSILDIPEDIEDTTDSESSGSRNSIITLTAKLSNHFKEGEGFSVLPSHPGPVFKISGIKKEKLDAKRSRSGDSAIRPVLIKSEPSTASSEEFGYHLFEQESLDLDDIGYKPDTPRKRRKLCSPLVEEPTCCGPSSRVGWINGGFTIKRVPVIEETQHPDRVTIDETRDENENLVLDQGDYSVPVFQPLSINGGEPRGIRADSPLARLQITPGVASAITIPKRNLAITPVKRSVDKVTEKKNQQSSNEVRISPPPLGGRPTSMPNQPSASTPIRRGLPVDEPIRQKLSPKKFRTRRRVISTEAMASITEDGADGIKYVHSDGDFALHPPIALTKKQRKSLEGTTRLSKILSSPNPKTPSLAHLKKNDGVSKSVPAKKPIGKLFENISSSEPPKRKAWVDPMRYEGVDHTKRELCNPSKLDISHFRINPDVNEGRDYAFAETVRNREARKCLPGCIKACCKELAVFVEAAGLPPPTLRGPRWRSSSPPTPPDETRGEEKEEAADKKFTAKFGRHRDAFARRRSPPGFWNADFPDTQDILKQNEVAEEMRLQKVEEMRKEAGRGGRGRYIYKG